MTDYRYQEDNMAVELNQIRPQLQQKRVEFKESTQSLHSIYIVNINTFTFNHGLLRLLHYTDWAASNDRLDHTGPLYPYYSTAPV
jgi:hypothetical protein